MVIDTLQTKRKVVWLYPLLLVPFLGLAALMVAAGAGQVAEAPHSAKIQVADVISLEFQSSYEQHRLAYGSVEASKQAQIGFELAGTVEKLMVDEGDIVIAGQRLAMLDTYRLTARMSELDAALARAESQARLAALSEKRVAELVRKKLESGQRLDEVRESTIGANALVTEINARKASLQVELDKSVIHAPFRGEILSRPVDDGTVVAAGQTILSMQNDAEFEARIALPADDAFDLNVGEKHILVSGDLRVPATIKSIARQRKLNTRTIDVLFLLSGAKRDVVPGDLLAFSYSSSISEAGFWVPKTALNSGIRGMWTLFTVTEQGEQAVSAKMVEVLHTEQDKVYVRGAVKPGDLLVLNGVHRLVPNQLVVATKVDNPQLAQVK